MEKDQGVDALAVGSDGTVALLLKTRDEKTEKSTYELITVDGQGEESLRADITKELKITKKDHIGRMLIDGGGRFVVTMDKRVCIFDEKGRSMGVVKSDRILKSAAVAKDGRVVCGVDAEDGGRAGVQVLDAEGRKWSGSYELGLNSFSTQDSLMDGDGYDFYYRDDSGVYGYDMAGKKAVKIMDYVASNITNIRSIIPAGTDKLLGSLYGKTGTEVILYSKVDPSAVKDKITITCGGVYINDFIKDAAIAFNESSGDYRIEFKDYSDEDEEDPDARLAADIVAGNAPDIIELEAVPCKQYIAKGVFEDLTPYYEKDPEIGTGDILDSVLEAMKTDNGIYYVTPNFVINTVMARKSEVGDGTGWTVDELKALLETKGDDVKLSWFTDKTSVLYALLGPSLSDFVDWQTGECRFDSQDFRDILEICNDRGDNEEQEYGEDDPSEVDLIKEGKLLLLQEAVWPDEFELYNRLFDGDFTYIGYPNEKNRAPISTLITGLGFIQSRR